MDIPVPVGNDDIMERTLDVLDGFLKSQERLVDIQQRRILVEERKADALEKIAENLQLNFQPTELIEETSVLDDEKMPEKEDVAETPQPKFHDRENINVPPPKFRRTLNEGIARKGRMMDPLSYANGVSGAVPSGHVDGNLFSSRTHSLTSEKKRVQTKESPSSTRVEKRIPRAIEKNKLNTEVKVIKRPRVAKAKATRVQVKTDTSSPVEGLLSREEVMHIIETMRKKGATFDQVAKHLVSIKQPTFSGRGEWHAQTVHRLCNKRK